jgi:hypothetical protein
MSASAQQSITSPEDVAGSRSVYPRFERMGAWKSTAGALPGAEIVDKSVVDLARGVESVGSLLVSIGGPRLERLGLELPPPIASPEHRLYALLAEDADGAHSRYNALIRRLVSFERAAECAS